MCEQVNGTFEGDSGPQAMKKYLQQVKNTCDNIIQFWSITTRKEDEHTHLRLPHWTVVKADYSLKPYPEIMSTIPVGAMKRKAADAVTTSPSKKARVEVRKLVIYFYKSNIMYTNIL